MARVKMGMVGGSLEAFIGNVHRMAAGLDGHVELVCGAFSSDPKKSKETGATLNLNPSRVYDSFKRMIEKEKNLPEEERMDFVSIVTPNFLHYEPAKMALKAGFHVMCEKPLAFSLKQAQELEKLVLKTNLIFGVTHNYTGYPMVKEARNMIKGGKLGKIRKVIAEYPQGWLSEKIEDGGQRQADWRTDPDRAGISCCVADIGTHAENLAEYTTGLKIKELAADVSTFVKGRKLDDDANILVRFDNGAKGVLMASQIATGEENELRIRIYGEKGSLDWLQSDPNKLIYKTPKGPQQIIKTGAGYHWLSAQTEAHTRLPGGHPEGYIESMANLYRNFAMSIHAHKEGEEHSNLLDFPTITDGVRGMKFIEKVIDSGKKNAAWVSL